VRRATFAAVVATALALTFVLSISHPPLLRAQGVDVFLNVTGGGVRKLNIAIPEFTVVSGTDTGNVGKQLATVTGDDLTFSQLFSVVAGTGTIPANNPAALKQSWTDFAAAGAHAALHGLVSFRGERVETEMRLYDLTTPEQRLIASKKFEQPTAQWRRLSHKIADEIVLQFTGEPGVADTKIAYVSGARGVKEILMADYDGVAATPVTRNGSINLMPVWSPDTRSLAYTSFAQGYPDLYRAFPFERRPPQTLAAFHGINSSPAWSPDGKSVAMTLSKDGNPEIYVLTLATGTLRRLTRHAGIDTEPTWSPSGREIAFISDRNGPPHLFVMDEQGASVRPLTSGGRHTQPRWSPKGAVLVYTQRAGTHDIWAINADGSNPRRLTSGPGDNQGPTWAPNGRHLMFQSNRLGSFQIFAMLADGSAQTPVTRGGSEATSPSWSPRLP
jgi:TolB protein